MFDDAGALALRLIRLLVRVLNVSGNMFVADTQTMDVKLERLTTFRSSFAGTSPSLRDANLATCTAGGCTLMLCVYRATVWM